MATVEELTRDIKRLESRVRWLETMFADQQVATRKELFRMAGATHMTASQVALLPGAPGTAKGARQWLQRHGISGRSRRSGRGGGIEYPVSKIKDFLR